MTGVVVIERWGGWGGGRGCCRSIQAVSSREWHGGGLSLVSLVIGGECRGRGRCETASTGAPLAAAGARRVHQALLGRAEVAVLHVAQVREGAVGGSSVGGG